MNPCRRRIYNQNGLTILETVIVLIIAGLIIGTVWTSYAKVNLNNRVNRTVTVIDKTVQAARDYLSSQATVPPDLSTQLYNQGLMPPDLSYTGNGVLAGSNYANFISPLGQSFYIVPLIGFPNIFFMYITFQPGSSQCSVLMPKLLGNQRMIIDRGIRNYNFGGASGGPGSLDVGNSNKWPAVPPTTDLEKNGVLGCSRANFAEIDFAMRP